MCDLGFDRIPKKTKRDKVRKELRYRCPKCNRRRSKVRGEKCDHCGDPYRKPSVLKRQVEKETRQKKHQRFGLYETDRGFVVVEV
jgi:ribosomal protein L37AE/L43A